MFRSKTANPDDDRMTARMDKPGKGRKIPKMKGRMAGRGGRKMRRKGRK